MSACLFHTIYSANASRFLPSPGAASFCFDANRTYTLVNGSFAYLQPDLQ